MNNEQIETEARQNRRRRTSKVVLKIIRYVFLALIIVVNGALIWRMCSSSDPSSMKRLLINDATYAAYEENGKDLTLYRQSHDTITRADRNYGYFSVTDSIFIPQANQVQIVFRYNNSTITSVAKDYELESVPSADTVLFDVTLVVKYTDGTEQRFAQNMSSHDTKTFYNYYRYNFDGVVIDESVEGVFVDIYYLGDVDYSEIAYGTLCIYSNESKNISVSLEGADRAALNEYPKNKSN